MNEEKMIQYLKDTNFWGEDNIFFYTIAPQSFSKKENIYGINSLEIRYYLINNNENGIAIIPFNITGKSIKELIMFIPNSDIKSVYIEKYKFMFFLNGQRLIIETNENKVVEIEFAVNRNRTDSNVYKFATKYNLL